MSENLLLVESASTLFALPATAVREVTRLTATTRLPGSPDYVKGLLNIRGVIFTVIDLAARVGAGQCTAGEPSVLVVQWQGRNLGLLVDDVHEVYHPAAGEGEMRHVQSGPGQFVASMGHFGDKVVLVVDMEELVRQTLA